MKKILKKFNQKAYTMFDFYVPKKPQALKK